MDARANVFLRPDVMVEPLFNQWLAVHTLIPPVSAAMMVVNKHLRIMRSFVEYPQGHVQALKMPGMVGGSFLALEPSRVPEVRELMERTQREHAEFLELDSALRALEKLLAQETSGESLERLYPLVPDALRGFVELKYDMQHRPSFRFFEPLLYRSRFYKERCQSVLLERVTADVRPFAYSTPRLAGDGRFMLPLPFRHEGLQALAAMRERPAPLGEMAERLGVTAEQSAAFREFFTEEAPTPVERFQGPGVRVRYFGHACILIESRDVTVLVDPSVSYKYPTDVPRFTFADLPERIDYVLITHGHGDHISPETLLQLRHKVGTVVVPRSNSGMADLSLKLLLQAMGFPRVRDLDELERLELPGGSILGVPFLGEHADLDVRAKLTYLVQLEGKSVLAAADVNCLEPRLYEYLREDVGELDALFLSMECEGAPMSWGYGHMFTAPLARKVDQSRRLNGTNFERARPLVELFKPKHVYNYSMGLEPWLAHVMGLAYTATSPQILESDKLIQYCQQRGIQAERPFARLELRLA
jgi:L-ascorbate metabolism protein UlaG (beta-lactamase superfamily)